jgi:hypothetical protein
METLDGKQVLEVFVVGSIMCRFEWQALLNMMMHQHA